MTRPAAAADKQAKTFTGFLDRLSWTHYRTLCRIEDRAERSFYEIEAHTTGWSVEAIERGAEAAVLVPVAEWHRLQAAARRSLKQLLLSDEARAEMLIPARGLGRRRKVTEIEAWLNLVAQSYNVLPMDGTVFRVVLVIFSMWFGITRSFDMNVITLKLPDELNAALKEVSRKRGLSKSAVVREALEQSLLAQGVVAGAAERWVAQWQGSLKLPDASEVEAADPRLAHLLAKHVR